MDGVDSRRIVDVGHGISERAGRACICQDEASAQCTGPELDAPLEPANPSPLVQRGRSSRFPPSSRSVRRLASRVSMSTCVKLDLNRPRLPFTTQLSATLPPDTGFLPPSPPERARHA